MSAPYCLLMSDSGHSEEASSMEKVLVGVACGLVVLLLVGFWAAWSKSKEVKTLLRDLQQRMGDEAHMNDIVFTLTQQKKEVEDKLDQMVSTLQQEKKEVEAKMTQMVSTLQQQQKKENEVKLSQMVSTLQQQRTGLEETKDQLTSLLEKVKTEKVENKKELQSVEDEIREREKQSDKPKELITAKENLLKAQWKLDETKRNYERLKMTIENLMQL